MNPRQGRSISPIEGWRLAFALAAALLLVATASAQPYPLLPLGDAVSVRLGPDLTRQTYRIDTPDAGALTVHADADPGLAIDLRLYREQSVLHADTGGGRQARVVTRGDLAAGAYLVRVDRVTGEGAVTLRASFEPSPYADDAEPNDRVDAAAPLTLGEARDGRLGYVSVAGTDGDDWYRLMVPAPGHLSVAIEAEPSLALDVRLYAPNGSTVLHADTGGGRSVRLVERPDLAPQTYFVRVTRVTGHGGYRVDPRFAPQPIPIDAEPNDAAVEGAALPLGAPSTGQLGYTDGARTDGDDWFAIDAPAPGALTVDVAADASLALDLRLYAPNGSTVLHADTGGGRSERRVERRDLAPGRYFVRVTRVSGHGGYGVSPRFDPQAAPIDPEPNDGAADAARLEPNQTSWGHLGYTDGSATDGHDWFTFELSEHGGVRLGLHADETLAVDLRLYAADGSAVLRADTGGGRSERRIERMDLAPGRYLLRVTRVTGYGGYRLSPAVIAVLDVDQRESATSAAAATPIEPGRVLRGLLGYVSAGQTAGDAYFRVRHDGTGPVTIVATAQEPLAIDLRLYDDADRVLRADTGGGRSVRSLAFDELAPGSYLVRVTRVVGHGTFELQVRPGHASLAVHPDRMSFPAVALGGEPVVVHGAILGNGAAPVDVQSLRVDGSGAFTVTDAPGVIPAGAVGAFRVAFAPSSEGPAEATLHVTTSAGSLALPLRGSGFVTFPGVPQGQAEAAPPPAPPLAQPPTPPPASEPPAAAATPGLPPHPGLLAWTDATDYAAGETVVVHYRGLPGNPQDWITVVHADESDDRYGAWLYTEGATSGTATFDDLAPATYEVRVYLDWPAGGYEVVSRYPFTVGLEPGPRDVGRPGDAPPPGEPPPAADAPASDPATPDGPARVVQASGPVLTAPDGTQPSDVGLVLETLAEVSSAAPFRHVGQAVAVRGANAVAPPPEPVDLVLPAPSEHAVALVFTLGEWLRVPARPVTLADGAAALAVRIDGLPLPWIVSVAELPGEALGTPDLASGPGLHATVARLEQLRVTDPAAMAAELARFDARGAALATGGGGLMHVSQTFSLQHVQAVPAGDATTTVLLEARLMFLRAYVALQPAGGGASAAAAHYVDGIASLHAAAAQVAWRGSDISDRPFADRAGLDGRTEGFERTAIYGGTLTVAEIADFYAGTFAPWGLDATRAVMVGADRALGLQFDVRVLHYYGTERFVNLVVPRRFMAADITAEGAHWPPAMIAGVKGVVEEARLIPGQASATMTLRLYSPRLLDITIDELYGATQTVLGGATWLYGTATLITTVSAGTAVPVGAAAVAGYNLVAPVLEYMFVEPRASRWDAEGFASKTTTLTAYSAGRLIGSVALDAAGVGGGGVAAGLSDVLLSAVIDHARLAGVNELRSLGTWGVRNPAAWFFQHQRFYAPPMEFIVNVAGPTTLRAHPADGQRPTHWPANFESYVLGGHGVFSVFVDPAAIEPRRLSEGIHIEPAVRYLGDLFGLPLVAAPFRYAEHAPVSQWAALHHFDEAPHAQVLSWTLEEETLEAWATAAGLETVDDLLERAVVEVGSVLGGDPYRAHHADRVLEPADVTLLRSLVAARTTAQRRVFAVAVTERDGASPRHPVEQVGVANWNESSVGAYANLMMFAPRHEYGQFELEYEVRLLDRGQELLSFPVGFSYHAGDSVNVEVVPTRGFAGLPPRKVEVSNVRPDVEHEFGVAVRDVEHTPTHSTFVFAAEDLATLDLSGFTFTWTIVSERGQAVAIGAQGSAVVTVDLPFDPADHPDGSGAPARSSPFDVDSPVTSYTVRVEVTRNGERVDAVETTVGVPGPYVIRIDQRGRE